MIATWLEFYKQHRNIAILTVTRALHPECKTRIQLEKISGMSRQIFLNTYGLLDTVAFDQSMTEDAELMFRLDALGRKDKALPAVACLVCMSSGDYFATSQIVDECGVGKDRVTALMDKLHDAGVVTVLSHTAGIFKVSKGKDVSAHFRQSPSNLSLKSSNLSLTGPSNLGRCAEESSNLSPKSSNLSLESSNLGRCATSNVFNGTEFFMEGKSKRDRIQSNRDGNENSHSLRKTNRLNIPINLIVPHLPNLDDLVKEALRLFPRTCIPNVWDFSSSPTPPLQGSSCPCPDTDPSGCVAVADPISVSAPVPVAVVSTVSVPDLTPDSVPVADPVTLEAPPADSPLKDKIMYVVDTWNWFCAQPGRKTKPVRVPKSFLKTGQIPDTANFLQAIERRIDDLEWDFVVQDWEEFLVEAETNTFIKMMPHKEAIQAVWGGVTLHWLFDTGKGNAGLDNFREGRYRSFQEDFIPYVPPTPVPQVVRDIVWDARPDASPKSTKWGFTRVCLMFDLFVEHFPDLPHTIDPRQSVDEAGFFRPEGSEIIMYRAMVSLNPNTTEDDPYGMRGWESFLINHGQLILKLDRDGNQTPFEWLFDYEGNAGVSRYSAVAAGGYDRKFGITSKATMKNRLMDVLIAFNATQFVAGGTLAPIPDSLKEKGLLTKEDAVLLALRDWIATTYEWRIKWKVQLRRLESGKLKVESLDEMVAILRGDQDE